MTRGERRSLVAAMDRCIDEFSELTAPWGKRGVIQMLLDDHSGVVGEASERIIWEGLAKLLGDRMKRRLLRDDEAGPQQLPLGLEGIDPPRIISLPPKQKGDDPTWIAFRRASPAHLLQHKNALDAGIQRDQKGSDEVGAILALVFKYFGRSCDHLPMEELFRRIVEIQAAEREAVAA